MSFLRLFILQFIVLFMACSSFSSSSAVQLSFPEWKSQKIQQAKLALNFESKKASKNGSGAPHTTQRHKELKYNLRIAQQLTASDYFQLYLAPEIARSNRVDERAVKSMSSAQLAEVLLNYAASLNPPEVETSQKMRSAIQLPE